MDAHQGFFTVGKKFRGTCTIIITIIKHKIYSIYVCACCCCSVPGFLATSFDKDVTDEFKEKAHDAGQPVVQWEVQVDDRGEHNPKYLCKNVNLLRRTHCPGSHPLTLHK